MNAVEREPVETRVLNPTASEASYKPKQRIYRTTNLKIKVLAPNGPGAETSGAELSSAETAAPKRTRPNFYRRNFTLSCIAYFFLLNKINGIINFIYIYKYEMPAAFYVTFFSMLKHICSSVGVYFFSAEQDKWNNTCHIYIQT